jgi:hypothetical protein
MRWSSFSTALLAFAPAIALAGGKPPAHDWKLIDNKHWQVVAPPGEDPAVTDAREGNRGACSAGMVEIKGVAKMSQMGDELQKSVCKRWINKDFPERCAEFDRDKWLAIVAKLPQQAMHFCIDRYEFPNRKGENPLILATWHESVAICTAQQKRLCSENEWTFACEGDEAQPYPYGYTRDPDACVVDKTWRQWDGAWARDRASESAKLELDRLWQAEPSGSRPKCKSPFGVYDMTGNIDEWTRASYGNNPAILKGGYWGPVRTRCRPTTRIHGPTHMMYQQGLRCCTDAPAAPAPPSP